MDALRPTYEALLAGTYHCLDRIVVNAYFRMGHDAGGFRVWWRKLTGSEEMLDNAHLMRMAGRFSRRLRAWATETTEDSGRTATLLSESGVCQLCVRQRCSARPHPDGTSSFD
jgi:hypothetical protein